MKYYVMLLLLMLTVNCRGQYEPAHFFSRIPGLNLDFCTITGKSLEQFRNDVVDVSNDIEKENRRRKEVSDEKMKKQENAIKKNMAEKSGLTPQQVAQFKENNKKTSKEEKEKIADSILQSQANMSLDELKKMKTRTKEGQLRWAEAMGKEQMAEASANPEKFKKEQEKNMRLFRLSQQLSLLRDSLNKKENKFSKMLMELDEDARADSVLAQIRLAEQELQKAIAEGANEELIKQMKQGIMVLEDIYCSKYSPRLTDILSAFKIYITTSENAYDRLAILQNELTNAQLGINEVLIEKGSLTLSMLGGYMVQLKSIFRYRLNWQGYGGQQTE